MELLCASLLTAATVSFSTLRTQCGPVGPMRLTHELAKIQPVVVCNFTPPLPAFVQSHNVIEASA
jgi:hypothetical protein